MRISDWSSDVCSSDLESNSRSQLFRCGESLQHGEHIVSHAAPQSLVGVLASSIHLAPHRDQRWHRRRCCAPRGLARAHSPLWRLPIVEASWCSAFAGLDATTSACARHTALDDRVLNSLPLPGPFAFISNV